MELLAKVWNVPVESTANDINQAKKGNYGSALLDAVKSILLGLFVAPRIATHGAFRLGEVLLEAGATRSEIVHTINHRATGETIPITIRKYTLQEDGEDTILYQAFHNNTFVHSKVASVTSMEGAEALVRTFLAEVESIF